MLKQACQNLLASKSSTLEEDVEILGRMKDLQPRDEKAELAVQWRMCQKR